ECNICAETKNTNAFPSRHLTLGCLHPASTCFDCISASVNAQFETAPSTQISCPECPHHLGIDDARRYLTEENHARYKRLFIENIAKRVRNLVWCPLGCGTSQVHSIAERQPIVQCHTCGRHFCYVHGVKWHQEHTCEEYDMQLRDS
ncbi:hypothetical protein F5883DRAFT_375098, partial [Diaporthe sp. PMI_573]